MARPPRKSGQRVSLTPATMQRIAKSVLAFEKGDRDMSGISLRTGGSECDVVRGTFTGSWVKGALATVTDSTLSAVTYDAMNYFANVGSTAATSAQQCVIGYVGGEWVLISAQPTEVTVVSDVKIVGASLRFFTAQVNVMGSGFGKSYIDVGLESC